MAHFPLHWPGTGSPGAGRRVALRLLRRTLLGGVIAWGAYLAVANSALRSEAVRTLLLGGQGFSAEYRSAWTLVPMVFHVRGLHLRAQHEALEWSLSFERCRLRVGLFDLFARRLRFAGVRADGGGMRLRPRLERGQQAAPWVAWLPPIAGLPSPPLRDGVPSPPDGPDSKAWSLAFSDAEVALDEVWLAAYHSRGRTEVRFDALDGFAIDPQGPRARLGRQVELAGARVVAHATVGVGSATLVEGLDLRVEATIHPSVVAEVEGWRGFVRILSGGLTASGSLPDLRAASHLLEEHARVRLRAGHGSFSSDLRLVRGVELPGSTLRLQVEGMTVTHGEVELSLAGSAKWGVGLVDGRAVGSLGAHVGAVRLGARAFHGERATARDVQLTLETRDVDHAKEPATAEIRLEAPAIQVPDLRLVEALLADKGELHLAGGPAVASASLSMGAGRTTGSAHLTLRARDLSIRVGRSTVRGHLDAQARATDLDLRSRAGHLAASAALHDATGPRTGQRTWSGKLVLGPGDLRFGDSPGWSGAVRAEVVGVRPLLPLLSGSFEIPGWVRSLGNVEDLAASGHLSLTPSALSLERASARAGDYRIEGGGRHRADRTTALALVTLGPLALAVEVRGDEHEVHLVQASRWYRSRLPAHQSAAARAPVIPRATRR